MMEMDENMDEDAINSSSGNYNDMKDKASSLALLVSKFVKVNLIKQQSLLGYIHSFDPSTHSIILLVPNEDASFQTTIIPGHAVVDLTEAVPMGISKPPSKECTSTANIDNSERKVKLISWLRLNLLPVSESGENIIFGNVTILPPYKATDICADNPIVAMQISKVMNEMPEDFNPVIANEENLQT